MAPAVLVAFLMSFTSGPESERADETTAKSEVVLNDGKDHCCCPPGWILVIPSASDDPAWNWDNNGDGFLCAKGFLNTGHPSDGTPKGKGNYSYDPLNQSSINIKDNNQPCSPDEFNPCAN